MPFLMSKGEQIEMKAPVSSIINLPAYQQYRSQQWKKWITGILLLLITLVLLFSLVFDRTIQAKDAAGGSLSLNAQTEILKQIVNPVSILLASGCLLLTAYAAIRYLRLRGISGRNPNEVLEVHEVEAGAYLSGPGFINTGGRNILILKNYQGYLRILKPVHPTQKNLFFFTAAEKVDQIINLQPRHFLIQLNCRTRDGIQILFPSVQIEYRFMVNTPSNNLRASSGNTKSDLGIIKTYLFQKGNLSEQEIIHFTSELVFTQIIRKFSLDELNGENPSREKNLSDEKISRHMEAIKCYKINALSKHWRNKNILAESARFSKQKKGKTFTGRTHQKQRHFLQKGLFTSAVEHENWEASPDQSFSLLEEKIKAELEKELLSFNILLLSLQLSNWQPVESTVRQKISQNQGKKAELLLSQKETGNRQIQQTARQAYLDMLHGRTLLSSQNYMNTSSSSLTELSLRAKKYRIPSFSSGENPEKDKGL